MELIRISDDKIKISLTKAELDSYEISVESMDYGAEQTRSVFKELFGRAKQSTGFDAQGNKVFVQIYSARDGGCEIFVSKLETPQKKTLRIKGEESFLLESLDDLLAVCRQIERIGHDTPSDAYSYGERFVLVLSQPSKSVSSYAREYGKKCENYTAGYINEHFGLIKKGDAVQVLARL